MAKRQHHPLVVIALPPFSVKRCQVKNALLVSLNFLFFCAFGCSSTSNLSETTFIRADSVDTSVLDQFDTLRVAINPLNQKVRIRLFWSEENEHRWDAIPSSDADLQCKVIDNETWTCALRNVCEGADHDRCNEESNGTVSPEFRAEKGKLYYGYFLSDTSISVKYVKSTSWTRFWIR